VRETPRPIAGDPRKHQSFEEIRRRKRIVIR
jgi:hypothetical protein